MGGAGIAVYAGTHVTLTQVPSTPRRHAQPHPAPLAEVRASRPSRRARVKRWFPGTRDCTQGRRVRDCGVGWEERRDFRCGGTHGRHFLGTRVDGAARDFRSRGRRSQRFLGTSGGQSMMGRRVTDRRGVGWVGTELRVETKDGGGRLRWFLKDPSSGDYDGTAGVGWIRTELPVGTTDAGGDGFQGPHLGRLCWDGRRVNGHGAVSTVPGGRDYDGMAGWWCAGRD